MNARDFIWKGFEPREKKKAKRERKGGGVGVLLSYDTYKFFFFLVFFQNLESPAARRIPMTEPPRDANPPVLSVRHMSVFPRREPLRRSASAPTISFEQA